MRQILAILALAFSASVLAGSSFHTVARVQSGVIPADILAAGKIWCVFIAPNGSWIAPPISNFCWAGNVTAAGLFTIKVYSWITGELAEGSAMVPSQECTTTYPPLCVIPFAENDGD